VLSPPTPPEKDGAARRSNRTAPNNNAATHSPDENGTDRSTSAPSLAVVPSQRQGETGYTAPEQARRAVRWTGCPKGCGVAHECGVGRPPREPTDWDEATGLFVSPGRFLSLRQWRESRTAA
jgi:hypothetical protein